MTLETILAALGIAAFVIDLAINVFRMIQQSLSHRPTMRPATA